jgi:hypothetical protein
VQPSVIILSVQIYLNSGANNELYAAKAFASVPAIDFIVSKVFCLNMSLNS